MLVRHAISQREFRETAEQKPVAEQRAGRRTSLIACRASHAAFIATKQYNRYDRYSLAASRFRAILLLR